MLLFIECAIFCVIFTLLIEPSVFKNPIKHIMSYPVAIRKRVESLPQYKDTIGVTEKKHIAVKIIFALVVSIILAIVAYFSGATTFTQVFIHAFIIFFVVNVYDVIVLDIIIFGHSKKVRIPGTEDMDKEYKDLTHHIIGGLYGIGIGILVALLSGGLVCIYNELIK